MHDIISKVICYYYVQFLLLCYECTENWFMSLGLKIQYKLKSTGLLSMG